MDERKDSKLIQRRKIARERLNSPELLTAVRKGGKPLTTKNYVQKIIEEAAFDIDNRLMVPAHRWRELFILKPNTLSNAIHVAVGKDKLPNIDTF